MQQRHLLRLAGNSPFTDHDHPMLLSSHRRFDAQAVCAWVAHSLLAGDPVLMFHRSGGQFALLRTLLQAGVPADAFRRGRVRFVDVGALPGRGRNGAAEIRAMIDRRLAEQRGRGRLTLLASAPALHELFASTEQVLDYERHVDDLVTTGAVRALCQYHRGEANELLEGVTGIHFRALHDDTWSAAVSDGALRVRGELDLSNTAAFAQVLRGAVDAGVHEVDLTWLTFCGVSACRALLDAADCTAPGSPLELTGVRPHIERVLRLTAHRMHSGLQLRSETN